jgi:hypothetical protein
LNAGASSPPLACFYSATLAWNLSAVDKHELDWFRRAGRVRYLMDPHTLTCRVLPYCGCN